MSIISDLLFAAKQEASRQMEIQQLKRGKSSEQMRVIDFFLNDGGSSGGCGGCLSRVISHNMSLDEYTRLVQDKCDKLDSRSKAIAKIGLDESEIQEIPPIMLASFVFGNDTYVKVQDHVAVSSQYAITWIFFSASQIYTYQYIFDTTSDNTCEYTNDFFYTDITCLTTGRYVKEKIDITISKGCMMSGQNVVKNNYVVDEFEIVVPGTKYSMAMRNSETFEQSLQAAKAMLREKKYSK